MNTLSSSIINISEARGSNTDSFDESIISVNRQLSDVSSRRLILILSFNRSTISWLTDKVFILILGSKFK